MITRRIRYLPVVEDSRLAGLILVNRVMQSWRYTIQQLQGYISGEYPG
jgi:signal-transduction protein with cAMP-binding, CBS, and nucleotidyltransferase domain